MYRELVEAGAEELGIDAAELASTLLALAVGDDGPRRREDDERPRQRKRREERLDAEGTFVSASFEGGRDREDRAGSRSSRGNRTEGKSGAGRGGRRHEDGTGTVYRIEVGHRDRVLPGAIVGALANEGGISGSDIGKIDILQSFSLVEIHTPLNEEQLATMGRATFSGRELRIRPDQGPGHGWDRDDNQPDAASRRSGRRENWRSDRRDDRRGGNDRWEDRGNGGQRGERSERRGGRWEDRDRGNRRGNRGGNDRWEDRGNGQRGGFRRNNDRPTRRTDRW